MPQSTINERMPAVAVPVIELADAVRDRREIGAVWQRCFGESPKRFDNYLTNPQGEGMIWVYRPDGESIRGAFGLHAQRLKIGDEIHSIGQIGNLAVDQEFRSAGPALKMQRTLLGSLDGSDRTLLLGVTEDAIALLKRTGCKPVGGAQRWVKILRSEEQLGKRLRPAMLVKLAAPLVDAGLRLTSRENYRRRSRGITTGTGTQFDERYDRLWEKAADQFSITVPKTSDYLTWRFHGGEESSFETFWVADQHGELRGFVVFERMENSSIEVAELMFDGPASMDLVIGEFLRHVRSLSPAVTAITWVYFGTDEIADCLQRYGFKARPSTLQTFLYGDKTQLEAMAPALFDIGNWYLSGSDLDV